MNNSVERPKAYSYIRMSSQQQLKGDSLRRQLDKSREYAAENNLDLDEGLRDIGISAWTGENLKDGALGQFLQLVKTGRIERGSFLLVESLDRLSRREVRNAIGPFVEIINAGITIVTLVDKQTYSETTVDENWTQLMMSLAIMSRAHEESQTKSARLKEAHAARRKRASEGVGRFSPQIWGWIDQVQAGPDKFEYRLNQHAETIKKIFEMADSGLGQLVITRRLNEAKILSPRGRPWQQPNIGEILKNEAVIGTYQPTHSVNKKTVPYGQPIKGYLPAAVSDELFWRVQRNRQIRITGGKKGDKLSNLFSSLCSCEHCGGPIRMRTNGSKNYPNLKYLHCDNKYRDIQCSGPGGNFRYDFVERAILDHVREFDADLGVGPYFENKENVKTQIAEAECTLEEADKIRKNLLRAIELADGETVTLDLLPKLSERRLEVESLKAKISELKIILSEIEKKKSESETLPDKINMERLIWTTGTDAEVYDSRCRVSRTIRRYVDLISFNFQTKRVLIAIGGGLIFYQFDKHGKLLAKRDNTSLLGSGGSAVLWKDRDENGRPVEGRGQIIAPRGMTVADLTQSTSNAYLLVSTQN